MDWKLELVAIPVSDVDRAKAFYTEKVGFNADHDHRVDAELRFVQLTPPVVAQVKVYVSVRLPVFVTVKTVVLPVEFF